jgi:spore maturation protein CgeB
MAVELTPIFKFNKLSRQRLLRIARAILKRIRQLHLYPKKIAMNRWWCRLLPHPPIEVLADEWLEVINPQGAKGLLYIALKYDYGDRSRGLSYEEHNFANCLMNLGDIRTYRLDFYSLNARYGSKVANAVLKEVIQGHFIDRMLLLLYKDVFDRELLTYIRDTLKVKTTIWLFDDDKRFEETKSLVMYFSCSVTTMPDRHAYRLSQGLDSKLCQFAANHFLYRDRGLKRDIDVIFIGQNFGDRKIFIDFLLSNNIEVKTYGIGWGNLRVSQGEMIELLGRSKIALNFSSSEGNPHLKFIKGRIFEIPATGAMLLTEHCEHLENHFILGEEVEVFSDKVEMLSKIRSYLADEDRRKRVALGGMRKVLHRYTMEQVLRSVI